MKNHNSCVLALSIGLGVLINANAGNVSIASRTAAKNLQATNYLLNAEFTNNPVTPEIATVSDIPVSADFFSAEAVSFTDGSGKIEGVCDLGWGALSNLGPYTQGDVIANVNGSITTVKSNAVVTMTMKGNGFAQDDIGSNQATANLSLTFKSNKGIVLMTNEFDSSKGPVIALTMNSDGSLSSNFVTVVIQTNLIISPNYQQLVFTVASSDVTTNSSTNVTISNTIDSVDGVFPFGNNLSTNGEQTFTIGHLTFTNVVIAYNLSWDSSMTSQPVTNAILGLDISQVPAFINNYIASQSFTNSHSEGRTVQTVVSVATNTTFTPQGTNGNTTGFTNVTVMNNFSNAWFEMDGNLNGSVRAGGFSHAVKNEPATLAANHTLFISSQGTGSNTTLQTQFGTNVGTFAVPTNDNGLWYVLEQPVFNDSLSVTLFTYFSSDVKQASKSMWFSAPQGDSHISLGFFGTGSLNPANKTFKASLTGVSFSHSTTYKLSGNTGPLVVDYTIVGNVETITNTAAVDNLESLGFDTNVTDIANFNFATNSGFTVTNFNLVATNSFVTNGVTYAVQNTLLGVPVPAVIVTNTIPNGITSVVLSGKVQGQTIGPIKGTNASLPAPQ